MTLQGRHLFDVNNFGKYISTFAWSESDDSSLLARVDTGQLLKSIFAWRKNRQAIVAVELTSPAPVDVKVVAFLIAIADKGVTIVVHHIFGKVIYGSFGFQLIVYQVAPFLAGIVVSENTVHVFGVTKHSCKEQYDIVGIGTRIISGIIHIHRLSNIPHQLSHSVLLLLGGGNAVRRQYVVPLEGTLYKLGYL